MLDTGVLGAGMSVAYLMPYVHTHVHLLTAPHFKKIFFYSTFVLHILNSSVHENIYDILN